MPLYVTIHETSPMFSFGIYDSRPTFVSGHLVGHTIQFTCGCIGHLSNIRGEYWGFRSPIDPVDCEQSH